MAFQMVAGIMRIARRRLRSEYRLEWLTGDVKPDAESQSRRARRSCSAAGVPILASLGAEESFAIGPEDNGRLKILG